MARKSFTLRSQDSPDYGSYLRYDDGHPARTTSDSALRADNLQTAPATYSVVTFDAAPVSYSRVDLAWTAPVASALTASPQVMATLLVYSDKGEPQTIASGSILAEGNTDFSYIHEGLPSGKWAYYSLFLHYQSNAGDDYYEKVLTHAILVPNDYASTGSLWRRIPQYYRNQDVAIGDIPTSDEVSAIGASITDPTQPIGPLFRFLSVFGFDLDYMRTLADYEMVSKDPVLATTETLNAIAADMGVDFRSSDLGAARLRGLLDSIGFFRRSKGTLEAVQFFASALAGADVAIDQNARTIKVYTQRANLVTVPKNGNGIVTHRAAYDTEKTTPNPFSTNMAAYSGTYTYSMPTFTTTGTGASVGVQCAMVHLSSPVPVQLGDAVFFSVQSNVGTDGLVWARLVNGSGAVMGTSVTTSVNGSKAFEINVTANASAGSYTTGYVEYLVDLAAVPSFSNTSLLAERNFLGPYFDGDTTRGGWLLGASTVSDYRWSGSANSSISLYAEDYERTKGIIDALLLDQFPITQAALYTITDYHAVHGF